MSHLTFLGEVKKQSAERNLKGHDSSQFVHVFERDE